MDRFVAHCVATAVITATLAAIPTVLAQPSGAAALPAGPTTGATAAPTPGAATGTPTGTSTPTPPATASPTTPINTGGDPATSKGAVCSDAYQVGSTVYAHWHGEIIFSVKQYYSPSCHARYSYGFPWLQFRNQQVSYDVGMSVFDVTHDSLDGGTTYLDGVGSPDYWSAPVTVPAGTCTEATVHLFLPDDETDTFTLPSCF